jgi:hypothetical protein
MVPALLLPKPGGHVLSPEIDWSIWAKKRAAIKMGFEDNHD